MLRLSAGKQKKTALHIQKIKFIKKGKTSPDHILPFLPHTRMPQIVQNVLFKASLNQITVLQYSKIVFRRKFCRRTSSLKLKRACQPKGKNANPLDKKIKAF